MKERDLKLRTKRFALEVIDMFEALPKDEASRVKLRLTLLESRETGE